VFLFHKEYEKYKKKLDKQQSLGQRSFLIPQMILGISPLVHILRLEEPARNVSEQVV